MHRPRPHLLALAVLAALVAMAGCGPGNKSSPFPLEVGFQPLEPATDAPLPAMNTDGSYPETLGTPLASGARDGHWWAHGRGYVHAPLAKVYRALHEPAAGRLNNGGSADWTMNVEPFPISYDIHYTNSEFGGLITVHYDVVYRGGPLLGTEAALEQVGFRYQKTSGVDTLRLLAGSTVALPTADPNVTEVQIVAWIDAGQYQNEGDNQQTVRDQFQNLLAVLSTLPP